MIKVSDSEVVEDSKGSNAPANFEFHLSGVH